MTKIYHPRLNDEHMKVEIRQPSTPTLLSCWEKAGEVATVMPDGALPPVLNGIRFERWTDAPTTSEAWMHVAGQLAIEEPAFNVPGYKAAAAGVAILEADGRIWLVSPSNRFGGYTNTFPKGRVEGAVSRQATAIREAHEESGLKVEITGFLADSDRTLTYTRYYLARRVGGSPADMGWESQAVHLVPREMLQGFLQHANDRALMDAILKSKK